MNACAGDWVEVLGKETSSGRLIRMDASAVSPSRRKCSNTADCVFDRCRGSERITIETVLSACVGGTTKFRR